MRKTLLKKRTDAEKLLGILLWYGSDWLFIEQKKVKRAGKTYYADFFLPHYLVFIELEGGIHSTRIEYDSRREHDIRTKNLSKKQVKGFLLHPEIIRVDNEFVSTSPKGLIGTIFNAVLKQEERIRAFGSDADRQNLISAMHYADRKRHFLVPGMKSKKCQICRDEDVRALRKFIKEEAVRKSRRFKHTPTSKAYFGDKDIYYRTDLSTLIRKGSRKGKTITSLAGLLRESSNFRIQNMVGIGSTEQGFD